MDANKLEVAMHARVTPGMPVALPYRPSINTIEGFFSPGACFISRMSRKTREGDPVMDLTDPLARKIGFSYYLC